MSNITEVAAKPEAAKAHAWKGLATFLLDAALLDANAVDNAIEALRDASFYLDDLGLDTREIEDLISALTDASVTISNAEVTIQGLISRELSDWPEASSVEAAMAAVDASIVAKLEAVLSENASLKARLAAFTQSDIAH
jgi:hypothetical protein